MTPSRGYLVLVLAGLLVPAACLSVAARLDGGLFSQPPSPFGWWSVLVVDLLAGLPLVVLLATGSLGRKPAPRWATGLLLLGAIAFTLVFGLFVGLLLDRHEVGWWGRYPVRRAWCLLLQLPLGVLLAPLVPVQGGGGARLLMTLLAGGSLVLPAIHDLDRTQAGTRQAETYLQEGQLARAVPVLDALRALGSSQPVAGQAPLAVRGQLERQLRQFRTLLEAPTPQPMSPSVRVERARLLAMLDRPDEAVTLLAPTASDHVDAMLLLASLYQKQRRFEDSNRYYGRAGEHLAALPPSPSIQQQQRRVVDGLAFNAREQGNYREAERLYHQALADLPGLQAHFHFQLGRHYHQGNRPGPALFHLDRAIQGDAERYGEPARQIIEEICQQTPGCLLRWPGS